MYVDLLDTIMRGNGAFFFLLEMNWASRKGKEGGGRKEERVEII